MIVREHDMPCSCNLLALAKSKETTHRMRPRKRVDWSIVVYQYWVRLEPGTWDALPEHVKREAEAMRTLWNRFVDAFEQRRAAAALHKANSEPCPTQRLTPPPVHLSPGQLHRYFFNNIKQISVDSSVAWANKQFVLTQFQAALSRFYKKQNRPPRRKLGPPEEVHFHHRFTAGGLPVERVFGRGQRLHLEPVSIGAFDPLLPQRQRKRLARTTGSFLVGDAPLSFHLILHRPLPQGAYLKAATLIGRQEVRGVVLRRHKDGQISSACWHWSLHLTLETPPLTAPLREGAESIAALNVACQFINEAQLRIAVLTDLSGREEEVCLPAGVLQGWRYKRTLQSRADYLVSEVKTQLRSLLETEQLPQAARRLLAHLEAIHTAGLWRLLALLESENYKGAILDIVRRWAIQSTRLLRETRGLERRYLNHRDWFYHNTALRLCRRYQRLVITTVPAGESSTFQQLAAPGRFIAFLLQAAKKTNTEAQVQNDGQYYGGQAQEKPALRATNK
jgi:hypothetical protein